MKKVELSQAAGLLSEYAEKADREPVVVTRRGRRFAALVPFDAGAWEDFVVSTHPDFIGIIGRSTARYKAEGGISTAEMRRRLVARRKAAKQHRKAG